jgi:hypothetical protein
MSGNFSQKHVCDLLGDANSRWDFGDSKREPVYPSIWHQKLMEAVIQYTNELERRALRDVDSSVTRVAKPPSGRPLLCAACDLFLPNTRYSRNQRSKLKPRCKKCLENCGEGRWAQ